MHAKKMSRRKLLSFPDGARGIDVVLTYKPGGHRAVEHQAHELGRPERSCLRPDGDTGGARIGEYPRGGGLVRYGCSQIYTPGAPTSEGPKLARSGLPSRLKSAAPILVS